MSEVVVCRDGEIDQGGVRTVRRAATGHSDDISVFYDGARYWALDDTCTHARAWLAEGWVEDGAVECPLHSASFRLSDGKALCLPAVVDARTHRVEVRDGSVVLHPGAAPA